MSRISLALLLALAACGGPQNYNQCILENVQTGMSDEAVRVVSQACAGEFPSEDTTAIEAPLDPPSQSINGR